jgi:DNA recombination protein RmuC
VLAAVRTEFDRYNKVVDKLRNNLKTAANSVEQLGTRTRVMGSKLKNVELLDGEAAQSMLGLSETPTETSEDEEEEAVAAE